MPGLLSEPLAELQQIFEAASPEALRTGEGISVAASLQAALSSPGASKAVPSLNARRVDQVAPGSLVRFYGMVQDVHDPEFFVGAYEEVSPTGEARLRTGKYRDMLDVQPNCTVRPRDDCTWQRTPVVCVPVPMHTEWAAREVAPSDAAPPAVSDAGARKSTKRGASDAEECEDMDMEGDAVPKKTQHQSLQRICEDLGYGEHMPTGSRAPAANGAADDPWSRATIGSCLVKMYDQAEECELKVNDVVEIFGVFELDLEPEGVVPPGADNMLAMVTEERALRPPPSAQPRLHCILHRKLPAQHHPLLPPPDTREEQLVMASARAQLGAVRPVVLAAFTSALGGDALGAEYALLSCVSRVIGRHGEAALGKLHLNISGCPAPAAGAAASPVAASLQKLLSELLPLCGSLAISPAALNAAAFAPTKDHEANLLRPGALQLPMGSTLLLDEAMMTAGRLDARGIENIKAVEKLLDSQKLGFDFTYFQMDFPTDITVLCLSCAKTMQPISCRVALQVDPAPAPMPPQLDQAEWLSAARMYFGLAARASPQTSIPEALTAVMQDDFVAERRARPDIGADDFARWLTMTRLLAGSLLEGEVRQEHYTRAKDLEAHRVARLKTASVTL